MVPKPGPRWPPPRGLPGSSGVLAGRLGHAMRRLAVLSLHTSPLALPGSGDGGGMNVYVRELLSALARAGMRCDVFTRAWSPDLPECVTVEPGFRVRHVPAGELAPMAKEALPVHRRRVHRRCPEADGGADGCRCGREPGL